MKIAFFTITYPMPSFFLRSFLQSIASQSCNNFDLIIGNDGNLEIDLLCKEYSFSCYTIVNLSGMGNFIKIRELLLRKIINDYDIIIFGDSDDFFSFNRVKIITNLIKIYPIIVNDFSMVGESNKIICSKYLSKRISPGQKIHLNFIKRKNIFGLSNTAVQSYLLKNLDFNTQSPALDWYLFYQILFKNKNYAYFTNQCLTFYRQHNNGISSFANNLNSLNDKLNYTLSVKKKHYQSLIKLHIPVKKEYSTLQNETLSKSKFPFWWE